MSNGGTHAYTTANHRLEAWTFADATARAAFTGYDLPLVADVGRVAYQADNGSYWRLSSASPITWQMVSGQKTYQSLGWFFEGTVSVGTEQGPTYTLPGNVSVERVRLYARAAPATSAVDVDVLRSTDGGTTWSTIFSTRPTIAAGSKTGGSAAVLSVATLNTNDLLRCDIVAAGGTPAAGLTVQLVITPR